MNTWTRTTDALPPEGLDVETMIADEYGVRNEALLYFRHSRWFDRESGMYMYYNPTHWRVA